MSERVWTEEERDSLCDALSKYSTKRALPDADRVDFIIRAVDRIMAARYGGCGGRGRCALNARAIEHPDLEMPDLGYVGDPA